MTRDFVSNPLTGTSGVPSLPERIMSILNLRFSLEQPMPHDALRDAVRRWDPTATDHCFDVALSELTNAERVTVTWGTGSDNKRTGYYEAVRKRATQTETLIGDSHED